MNNANVQVASPVNSPTAETREGKLEKENEGPSWVMIHASELVASFSVIVVLVLAFAALSLVASPTSPPWLSNSTIIGVLVFILAASFLGLCISAWQAARGEQMIRDRETYVLSQWSLKTLTAAGLPADLTDCLQEILSTNESAMTVYGRERAAATWITDLEATLGESRVAEYEEMLFRYTARKA